MARGNNGTALWIVNEGGGEQKLSFAEISERSNRVANYLRGLGVKRGDRVLLMLGNVVPLWESMLAAMKLGAVVIPATTLLDPRRSDRPLRARPGPPRNHQRRQYREIRRHPRRLHAHRGWRHPATPGMAPLRGRLRGSGRVRAGRRDARHRPAAAVFHLGHDGAAEAGAAQPSELSGRPSGDDVLDRPRTRRHPSEHLVAGLGEARL